MSDAAFVPESFWNAIMADPDAVQDPWPHFRALTGAACSHASAAAALRDPNWSVVPQIGDGRPLPVSIICDLMDLPADARSGILTVLNDFNLAFVYQRDEAYLARGDAAVEELLRRMRAVIAERRRAPGDDLVSRLVSGDDDPGTAPVEDEDLAANAVLLLQAGHETTMNTIASCTFELLRHPEQLAALRADPSLVAGAVEESLRGHVDAGSVVPFRGLERLEVAW